MGKEKDLKEIMSSKPYNGAYWCYYDVSEMIEKIKKVSNPFMISRNRSNGIYHL